MAKADDQGEPGLRNASSLLIVGIIAAVSAGGAPADAGSKDLERLAATERYWQNEVKTRRLSFDLRSLDYQECQVEMLAKALKAPIIAARRKLLERRSNTAASVQQDDCKAIAEAVERDREKLAAAELQLEEAQEDHQIAAGLIPRHSPSFAWAWQTMSPSWSQITASPKFSALDEAGRESVRLDYWSNYVMPRIPTAELRRAQRQFDQLTAATKNR